MVTEPHLASSTCEHVTPVSRSLGSDGGSHVLGYADTEKHALFGTPDRIGDGLAALSGAGVDYVLVQLAGGAGQVRRIARDVLAAVART